ncbi:hypothetical protein QUA07_28280 [Microcoleus sp. T3_A4]|uniref:hypothetical protein n=1 Tax=Microcoleus sp. T3_A4 TaxID=2818968 RepID=UPI002FCE7D39
MLTNKNQAIVSTLLGIGIAGFAGAVALPFNDQIEFKLGNRIESRPAWLVPAKAEFKGIQRGYGGIKILLALLATGGMVATMLIARKEGELEPVRQRIKKYQEKAYEFGFAAESAYQMSTLATRYKKLADADEVAIEGEIEAAYMQSLGIDPNAQQPLLTGTATLDSIANPGDKVQQATSPAIEPEQPEQTDGPKMPDLTWYPSVLIHGVPGAGKTFFVEQEVKRRLAEGHQVVVLDPHAAYGQWEGCEIVGTGMDYEAIDAKLRWFRQQVKDRYKERNSKPNPTFKPLTIVGEEFTNWECNCEESDEHYRTCNTDIRKVECYSIIVSHLTTQAGLGGGKGLAKMKTGMIEVELVGIFNPVTKRATPKFEAWVKLPGQKQSERTLVKLAKHHSAPKDAIVDDVSEAQDSTPDNPSGKEAPLPQPDAGNLPNPYGKGTAGTPDVEGSDTSEALEQSLNSFLAEVLAENLPPIFADDFPLKKHERRVQLAKLVIAKNLGKQKTIFLLWGVTDGGRNHQRYVDAREMLEKLSKGDNNDNN